MKIGQQSWRFASRPGIMATGTVVGPFEGKGPMGNEFDRVHDRLDMKEDSWEKAEKAMFEDAVEIATKKASIQNSDIDVHIGGDLLNQIVSSTFAARTFQIPFLGVFGACSTSMESLALAALLVDAGAANIALALTGSHNAATEKQYRYPTEYGSQKSTTTQYTVTGAGAALVGKPNAGAVITSATIGKIVDLGITDPFNMGAAMAPAAADTIAVHLSDMQLQPKAYDLIVTGDLASVGYELCRNLLKERSIPIQQTRLDDCGIMIYDRQTQKVHAGGSGCGCSAVVTYGPLLNRLVAGEWQRILVVATGALLSPITFQQGESIPCIAHAVAIENAAAKPMPSAGGGES